MNDDEIFLEEGHHIHIKGFHYHDLYNIRLKVYTDVLQKNIVWSSFFIYKLMKSVKLLLNGVIVFQTNGLFIKSKIDVLESQYQKMFYGYVYDQEELMTLSKTKYEFEVPLFLFNNIPLTSAITHLALDIELDKDITCPYLENPPIKVSVVPIYRTQLPPTFMNFVTTNNLEHIPIPLDCDHLMYSIKNCGLVKYVIIHVIGESKIDEITFSYNGITGRNHKYIDLNQLSPYYYLGKGLPKEYMYLSFDENGQGGINYDRFDHVNITFKFQKNNGGDIYLLSENKNILRSQNAVYAFLYIPHSTFMTSGNIMFKPPKKTKELHQISQYISFQDYCLLCLDEVNSDIYYKCIQCQYLVHESCFKKLNNYKRKCPSCQSEGDFEIYKNKPMCVKI
jgi:hypothetical protein